jgi:hypothetical protein
MVNADTTFTVDYKAKQSTHFSPISVSTLPESIETTIIILYSYISVVMLRDKFISPTFKLIFFCMEENKYMLLVLNHLRFHLFSFGIMSLAY